MDLPSWEIVELSLDLFPVPCHKMDGLKVLIFTGLNSSNFCIKELVFWFDGVYLSVKVQLRLSIVQVCPSSNFLTTLGLIEHFLFWPSIRSSFHLVLRSILNTCYTHNRMLGIQIWKRQRVHSRSLQFLPVEEDVKRGRHTLCSQEDLSRWRYTELQIHCLVEHIQQGSHQDHMEFLEQSLARGLEARELHFPDSFTSRVSKHDF